MPLFFVPMLGLMGIGIAMIRRSAQASPDELSEDVATRLLRWAVGLLSPHRAEWGQAMLGELDHLNGRIRRVRFALGCVGAALLLPPRGRTAAGVWAMIALAVGSVGVYAAVAIHYRLGGGDWIAAGILTVFVIASFLGASALVRRPDVAIPGLVGGLFVALASLILSGFTFLDQILPDIVPWHPWVITVAVPLVVGAAGTLWSGDPIVGKRIARLAAITGGVGLYVYATIAVAAVGGSAGFAAEGGGNLRGTISDRLGNNLILMLVIVTVTATVGWGGAAATGALPTARMRPATTMVSVPVTAAGQADEAHRAPMPAPQEVGRPVRRRNWRRTAHLLLLCAVVAAAVLLAAGSWLRG